MNTCIIHERERERVKERICVAVKFNLSIRRVLAYYPFMHNNEREWARKKHKFCFSVLLFVRNSSTPTVSLVSLSLLLLLLMFIDSFFSSQSISFAESMYGCTVFRLYTTAASVATYNICTKKTSAFSAFRNLMTKKIE